MLVLSMHQRYAYSLHTFEGCSGKGVSQNPNLNHVVALAKATCMIHN